MFRKVVMAVTVLVLLMLVILTPKLLGRSDVSSFPTLRFTVQDGQIFLLVTSVSGDYLYRDMALTIDNGGKLVYKEVANNSFTLSAHLPVDQFRVFNVTSDVHDRIGFTYKLERTSFVLSPQTNGWIFYITSASESRTFRQVDISGGTATTFSIIFPRREAP